MVSAIVIVLSSAIKLGPAIVVVRRLIPNQEQKPQGYGWLGGGGGEGRVIPTHLIMV